VSAGLVQAATDPQHYPLSDAMRAATGQVGTGQPGTAAPLDGWLALLEHRQPVAPVPASDALPAAAPLVPAQSAAAIAAPAPGKVEQAGFTPPDSARAPEAKAKVAIAPVASAPLQAVVTPVAAALKPAVSAAAAPAVTAPKAPMETAPAADGKLPAVITPDAAKTAPVDARSAPVDAKTAPVDARTAPVDKSGYRAVPAVMVAPDAPKQVIPASTCSASEPACRGGG
jgi:hypothetical protein